MKDASWGVQVAVVAKVVALGMICLDANYGVPLNQDYPYVTISMQDINASDKVLGRQEFSVILHLWDRYNGSKRIIETKDAIMQALVYDGSLAGAGFENSQTFYESFSIIAEPENEVCHGILQLKVWTCQN